MTDPQPDSHPPSKPDVLEREEQRQFTAWLLVTLSPKFLQILRDWSHA